MTVSHSRRSDLESIGRFSRRSRIPVSHLRHYHEVGLLLPAYVDPESGYRYYAIAQQQAAEVIGILRSVDMSVRDIQGLLADPSEPNVRDVLAAHRARLEKRLSQAADRLESIDRIVKEGTLMKKANDVPREGFVPANVKEVATQIPSAERWSEYREKVPMLPEEPQQVHLVTLASEAGGKLTLFVGSFEGNALKLQIDGIKTERPMTYDLMLQAFAGHGVRIVRADIVRVADTTYFAELTTASDGQEQTFDCRPSDALNLALRAGAPIAIAQAVLDQAESEEGSKGH